MYHFMGYNKDRDIYNELATCDDKVITYMTIEVYRNALRKDELKDETGEPYDWIEVWDDEDDNSANDIMIERQI